jgi:hypothetical protein
MNATQTCLDLDQSGSHAGAKGYRRLKSDELVRVGDFIANDRQEFEAWEGPSGFRADAFVRAIYRRLKAIRPRRENLRETP